MSAMANSMHGRDVQRSYSGDPAPRRSLDIADANMMQSRMHLTEQLESMRRIHVTEPFLPAPGSSDVD